MASFDPEQYGEWTDDPHYTTDCHYTDVREELTRWLRGDHDGWNNWLVYTRLEHTNPPTLINFAYIHLDGLNTDVEKFVEKICQLVETGAIAKDISGDGGGLPSSSSSLSTFVTTTAAAPTLPLVAALPNDSDDGSVDFAADQAGTKGCTNKKERIKEGGCGATKGFGYASAHNCRDGDHYACRRGGKDECLKINDAKKQGLEGGYCYTE